MIPLQTYLSIEIFYTTFQLMEFSWRKKCTQLVCVFSRLSSVSPLNKLLSFLCIFIQFGILWLWWGSMEEIFLQNYWDWPLKLYYKLSQFTPYFNKCNYFILVSDICVLVCIIEVNYSSNFGIHHILRTFTFYTLIGAL
jgi:hypothetical protein